LNLNYGDESSLFHAACACEAPENNSVQPRT
jgi:hypothetical protein